MGVGETFIGMGIIITVMTLGILHYVTRGGRSDPDGPATDDLSRELATTRAEVQALKERVRVLEQLATDPEEKLAREINSLGGQAHAPR